MANTNGAFGLRPIGVVGQAANTTGATEYRIASGNTNAIYQGSPVIPLSTGFIDIVGAAAGGTVGLLGVFWGCEYVSSTTGEKVFSNYWPGSGADSNHPVKAFVYDNPMQTYVICSDASLTNEATARGHVFANANFANADAGSSTTGISSGKLAVSTIATTAALQLRIMGIQDDPENADFTAAGIPLIVRLNNSFNSRQWRDCCWDSVDDRRIRRLTHGYLSRTASERAGTRPQCPLWHGVQPVRKPALGNLHHRVLGSCIRGRSDAVGLRLGSEQIGRFGHRTMTMRTKHTLLGTTTRPYRVSLSRSLRKQSRTTCTTASAARYTRALARSMAHTKQVKAAAVLNNAFTGWCFGRWRRQGAVRHRSPAEQSGGTFANEPTTACC